MSTVTTIAHLYAATPSAEIRAVRQGAYPRWMAYSLDTLARRVLASLMTVGEAADVQLYLDGQETQDDDETELGFQEAVLALTDREGNALPPPVAIFKLYRVTDSEGIVLGEYEASGPDDALDAMAVDSGYHGQTDAIRRGLAPFRGTVAMVDRDSPDLSTTDSCREYLNEMRSHLAMLDRTGALTRIQRIELFASIQYDAERIGSRIAWQHRDKPEARQIARELRALACAVRDGDPEIYKAVPWRVEGRSEQGQWAWQHVAGTLEDAVYDCEADARRAMTSLYEQWDPDSLRVVPDVALPVLETRGDHAFMILTPTEPTARYRLDVGQTGSDHGQVTYLVSGTTEAQARKQMAIELSHYRDGDGWAHLYEGDGSPEGWERI